MFGPDVVVTQAAASSRANSIALRADSENMSFMVSSVRFAGSPWITACLIPNIGCPGEIVCNDSLRSALYSFPGPGGRRRTRFSTDDSVSIPLSPRPVHPMSFPVLPALQVGRLGG